MNAKKTEYPSIYANSHRKAAVEKTAQIIFTICAFAAVLAVISITLYMIISGVPAVFKVGLKELLFGTIWKPTAAEPMYGIFYVILTSISGTFLAILIGVPIGVGTAVFLAEVAPKKVAAIIKPAVELLAGIPSVIYGLLGILILNPAMYRLERYLFRDSPDHQFTGGANLISAVIVLAIMILPTVINISESAIRAVPGHLKSASLALGATKMQTIIHVILPAAKSGIITAVVLGIGRAIGEAMAISLVSGNSVNIPLPFNAVRFLTTAIVSEMSYSGGLHRQVLFTIGLVLFVFIMIINVSLNKILKKNPLDSNNKPSRWRNLFGKRAVAASAKDVTKNGVMVNYKERVQKAQVRSAPAKSKSSKINSRRIKDGILKIFLYFCALFSILLLLGILCYVFSRGLKRIDLEFLTTVPSALNGTFGIAGNIVNTLYIVGITLLIVTPLGIGAAIYLNEYAKPGKIVRLVEFTTETLAGIPSIIYGLFGMVFFGVTLNLGYSILTGALTLSLMVLPLITRNTQEALKTVPGSYRNGALGIGATKWYMIRTILLPSAMPGTLTGIILAVGRMVGESAALLFTAGSGYLLPKAGAGLIDKVFQDGGTLTIQMYLSMSKAKYDDAFGIAAVLLIIVLFINFMARFAAKRYDVNRKH